jgi:hypothetical protein
MITLEIALKEKIIRFSARLWGKVNVLHWEKQNKTKQKQNPNAQIFSKDSL